MSWSHAIARLALKWHDELVADHARESASLRSKLRRAWGQQGRLTRQLALALEDKRELAVQLEELRASLTDSRELLSQARAREAALEDQLHRSRQQAQHHRSQRGALAKEAQRYRQLRHDYAALSRRYDQRTGELAHTVESAEQGRNQLVQELTLKKQKVATLKSALSEMAVLREALDGEVLRLEGLLKQKEEALAAAADDGRRLAGQLEGVRASVTQAAELLSQGRAREAALEDQLRRSRHEAQHHRARREALAKQAQRNRPLRRDFARLNRRYDQRTTELAHAIEGAEQSRRKLDRELILKEQKVAALESRLSEVASVKEALDADVLRLEGLLEQKDKALVVAAEERKTLVASLDSVRQAEQAQQDTVARLETEVQVSQVEIERLSAALAAEGSVIGHQQAEIDRLFEELNSVRRWLTAISKLDDVVDGNGEAATLLEAAAALLPFERGTVAIMESGREELRVKATSNHDLDPDRMLRLGRGRGIAGWSLEHQEPLLVLDSRLEERFIVSSADHGPASYLTVPLLIDSSEPAVLTLTRQVDNPFSERDLHIVHQLCRHAEHKLDRARVTASLRLRSTLLEELQETSRELLSANDRPQLIAAMLRAACKMGQGSAALLALQDIKTLVLEPAGSTGLPDELAFSRLGWGAPVATMASKSGEPWVVSVEDVLPPVPATAARAVGIEALVSIPCQTAPLLSEVRDGLLVRRIDALNSEQANEVRGVLNVYRKTTEAIPPERIEQLQLLASYGVAALKAVGGRDRMKRELQVAAAFSAHLLGRERQIEQLQARLRQLEETLSA
jgi:GAF domain-containing protein